MSWKRASCSLKKKKYIYIHIVQLADPTLHCEASDCAISAAPGEFFSPPFLYLTTVTEVKLKQETTLCVKA